MSAMLRNTAARLCSPSTASTSAAVCQVQRNIWTWRIFKRWQDGQKEEETKAYEDRITRVYGGGGMYLTPEDDNAVINKPRDEMTRQEQGGFAVDFMGKQTGLRYLDWSPRAIRLYRQNEKVVMRQYDQRYIAERHLYLGADLAAAHFLVHRGAAVKFVGDDTWYKRDGKGRYQLPGAKVPGLYLEAIDASETELMWEGFDNMVDLHHVRLLRLANCPHIDDWCMSKMPHFSKSLELLDLSGCDKVSANGLSALGCLKKLKHLRLNNVGQSSVRATKETGKVALMLEECIPALEVSGVDFDTSLAAVNAHDRLASDKRIVEDALGNLHAVDDNGHFYNVGGRIERILRKSLVDDWDRPMVTSRIRRDVPSMPLSDLIRLDRLSRHRIKHMLIGSPSSLHWNEDIEHIIGFNAALDEKSGADTPTFLLPDEKLRARLEADGDDEALAELEPKHDEVCACHPSLLIGQLDDRRPIGANLELRLISAVKEKLVTKIEAKQ